MTTDEVILRREKAAANGESYTEPPPRLRGQSTYLALLSSLATDLDIMLNDLRSSPSTRLLPASHQLQQRSSTTPLTVSDESSTHTPVPTGYLPSALRSSNRQNRNQQHAVQIIAATQSTTAISNTSAATTQQQQPRYQRHRKNNLPTTAATAAKNLSPIRNQQQRRLTQNSTSSSSSNNSNNKLHATRFKSAAIEKSNNGQHVAYRKNTATTSNNNNNNKVHDTDSDSTSTSTTTATTATNAHRPTTLVGLSPDVRQIQKLPLWSYQHKQLQQPQKLHVQLLQQQQATRAIASQITQKAHENAVKRRPSVRSTESTAASSHGSSGGNQCIRNASNTNTTNTKTTTTAKSSLTTSATSIITNATYKSKCAEKRSDNYSETVSSSCSSWLQTTSSKSSSTATAASSSSTTCYFGLTQENESIWSSDPGSIQTTTIANATQPLTQNQLKLTTTAITTAKNANATANSNNNNNNNTRRLPFCGLDSIKGSDNNGDSGVIGGGGGETNLSFDLNLQNDSVVVVGNVGGSGNGGCVGKTLAADAISEQFHSLDANESSCCGDEQFEDDMQALLPKCQRISRDELSPSRTSLVSSSDGGILAEGETSSETSRDGSDDDCPPCDLGLVERLLLTHPVWFLPGIQRAGAVHFLQGKEEGNFIVRGASQPNTMAVSVRLPPDTGPYIEHYLIQSNEGILSLESSRFKFDSIPALIAHYAQCCDELPVQLVLPRALREAKNRQQLSSLALLGQEFWRYPMSCPKTNEPSATAEAQLLDAKSPNSLTDTSGLGTTVFSNSGGSACHGNVAQTAKLFSPTNNLAGLFSQAGTPSDTTSSMSSFTTSGGQHMQLMSPESIDSVILTMSPVDVNNQRNVALGAGAELINAPSNLSTFKANGAHLPFKTNRNALENGIRPQRPKPPNTLNLDLRKPPAPPLRWSKPVSPHSPPEQAANNFTVTTTVTFSVDNKNSPQIVEVTTPATSTAANNPLNAAINSNASTFQTFSKRLSPEGECKDTLSSQGSSSNGSRWQSQSSKDSNNSQRKILSPGSTSGTPTSAISGGGGGKSRKSKARKESKHYQESDILESPQIYCRSALGDKISDYEDLWTHDPSDRTGLLTSFKPTDGMQGKRPDLLAETPTITSLNSNLLSPVNSSLASSASAPHANDTTATPTPATTATNTATDALIQFSGEAQPRSRAGLLLPGLMSQSLSEDKLKTDLLTAIEGDITPTALTPNTRSKQGSPFYAEPADALRQAGLATASILRRSQRGPLLPANHRHSEPPKSGITRTHMCPLLAPAEIEKIAGSLDELKKKQQQTQQAQPQQQPSKRARGRFEQWQLDSSWEFMGKQDDDNDAQEHDANFGDYDKAEQWEQPLQIHQLQQSTPKTSQEKENSLGRDANKENKPKPITVHQIIAKRFPDLNLPELVRCSTPPQQPHNGVKSSNELSCSQKSVDSQNSCRLSSYDNVERNYSYCQTIFSGIDSAQSDDGTVFSEPWDSSQWDSIMPQDDTTITSDTIHLSKCRPALSEDDTIIDELSTKENNQDTLKAKKTNGRQKVATILRNPSMRDREVLCHPRNKINPYGAGPGDTVRAYTLQLAQDECSTFARNIENFISCTKESREAAPQVVMRNMRQFMNGMKNYLVKHGEGKFHQEVESARGRLKSDEFLNLDAILETVMHQLVVLPLREHLYGMFVDYYTRSKDIQLLAQNVKYACGRCASDFGIRASVTPPSTTSLHVISNLLLRLQEAELPLDKLDLFLVVISTIFDATGCPRGQQLGADDFLPILVYVVAKCGFVGAEIEAEFMWGLLQPTLLNGEPGYYLTALCSAVHVLKSFMASENESGTGSLDWRSSSLPACSSVLRVIIPDECNGSLQTRTLPVRPHTTTREVCRIIAHKARITNPQDYALFKLVDGEETLLNDVECPQDIRLAAKGKHCMLAYKRIDAKIAWPTATQPQNFNFN